MLCLCCFHVGGKKNDRCFFFAEEGALRNHSSRWFGFSPASELARTRRTTMAGSYLRRRHHHRPSSTTTLPVQLQSSSGYQSHHFLSDVDRAAWQDHTHNYYPRVLQNNDGATAAAAAAADTKSRIDWKLRNCCETQEIAFFSLMGVYLVVICLLWRTILMKPMKLIAVFVHGKWYRSV